MSTTKKLVATATAILMLVIGLSIATPARAQYAPINWGDYDDGHTWRDAAWWYQNQPDWARAHHPEWWGDYDSDRQWQPAAWWWQHDPNWVQPASSRMVG